MATATRPLPPPEHPYNIPSENRAYYAGLADGEAGRPISYRPLATTWPDAYHRGYWEGVYDREYRAQQGERDSV